MLTIKDNEIIVDQPTTALLAYRLEDTVRAPAIIVFIDDRKPELLPIRQGETPPTRVRSHTMATDIEVITYAEITAFLSQGARPAGTP